MISVATGNLKLGDHIKNLNLLPVVTCVPGVPCAKRQPGKKDPPCYSCKALHRPNVKRAWTANTKLAKSDPVRFFAEMEEEWAWNAPRYFRFFSSGDVPTLEFLREMVAFIRRHPETRFLVFTKRYGWWNRYSNLPDNLSLVYSAWPGWKMSNPKCRPVAWMRDPENMDDRIPSDAIECPGLCENCLACWGLAHAGLSVVFDKH